MLHRLGLIPGTQATPTHLRRAREVLAQMAAPETGQSEDQCSAHALRSASQSGVAEVVRRFKAYAERGGSVAVCLAEPRCTDCNLKEHCKQYRKPPTIKQLPEEDRPRERLLRKGDQALSDAELLAILIRSGRGGESAVALAGRLLVRYGGLRSLSQRSLGELCGVPGMGPAKAAELGAAFALARRLASAPLVVGDKFTNSRQVFDHFRYRLCDLQQEVFLCLMLDTKNKIIREKEISRGGLESSGVNPRDVFGEAVRETASAVIFVHNHPSGEPAPSREDVALTRRLKEAGEVLGLRVLDHVIIGKNAFYSFADEGRL
jgi:DNA repair protein RadC